MVEQPAIPARLAGRPTAGGLVVPWNSVESGDGRLRTTVHLGHLAHRAGLLGGPLRLDRIPRGLVPRVAVGDSLLIGKISRAEYNELHPQLADLPAAAFPLDDFAWPQPDQPDLFAGVG